jgi:hypothetical protein
MNHAIRTRNDLVEFLRARKEQLGLSNAFVETQMQMTDGGCDKVLGPTQAKGMSVPVMLDMIELFGARLVIQVDAESEARMCDRYERRNEAQVRPQARFSKKLLAAARKQIFRELSRRGNEARQAKLSAKSRSRIASAAATFRGKQRRAAVASGEAQA